MMKKIKTTNTLVEEKLKQQTDEYIKHELRLLGQCLIYLHREYPKHPASLMHFLVAQNLILICSRLLKYKIDNKIIGRNPKTSFINAYRNKLIEHLSDGYSNNIGIYGLQFNIKNLKANIVASEPNIGDNSKILRSKQEVKRIVPNINQISNKDLANEIIKKSYQIRNKQQRQNIVELAMKSENIKPLDILETIKYTLNNL